MYRRVRLTVLIALAMLPTAAFADGDDLVERIRKSPGGEILFNGKGRVALAVGAGSRP